MKKKEYEKMWRKIKGLIISIFNNSDDYDEKYMKIKFNSGDDFQVKKTLELYDIKLDVRSIFYEGNKYYPQVL